MKLCDAIFPSFILASLWAGCRHCIFVVVRLSLTVLLFALLKPVTLDVTFAVAGGDGDGGDGRLARETDFWA